MNKIRLIISNYDDISNPFYGGGGAIAINEITKRLTKHYEILVITANYPNCQKRQNISGVNYLRIGIPCLPPKLNQFLFQLTLPIYLYKIPFDIWIESLCPPFSTSLMPLLTKKPIIGLIHMLPGVDMQRKYHLPFTLWEKFILRIYNRFIAVNDYISQIIQTNYPQSEVTTIPNGIDFTRLPIKPNKPKYLLYLGRIEINQKGIDILLSAYKNIISYQSPQLIIAGKGTPAEENNLRQLIKKMGLQNFVKLTGWVSGSEKIDLITSSYCVICPSRYESFSLVALECLYFKTPLICTDIPGFSWIPNNLATKIPVNCPEQLSLKILEHIKYHKKYIPQLHRGHVYARKYSWEKSAKKYQRYIKQITSLK